MTIDAKTGRMIRGFIRYETIGPQAGLLLFLVCLGGLFVVTFLLYGLALASRLLGGFGL